ncbi:MAG: hypothetical protein WC119_10150 [Synergistaceae bacterium]|jgi:hypothetical protein
MSIQTILDNAMTDLFNHVGQDATYTPVSGAALPCKVWVQNDVELQPFDFQGMAVEMTILIECLLSEVQAVPQRGSTFLVGTRTYTVQTVHKNDNRIVVLVVK